MKEIDSNLNIQKNFNLNIKETKYYHNEVCKILQGLSYKEKFNIVKEVDRNLLKKVNTFTGTKAVHTLNYISCIPYKKKTKFKRRSFIEIKNFVYVMGCKRLFC